MIVDLHQPDQFVFDNAIALHCLFVLNDVYWRCRVYTMYMCVYTLFAKCSFSAKEFRESSQLG